MADTATNPAEQNALSQGRNFVWHEVYTPDAAGSEKFYTEVLGFGTTTMEMGGHGSYKMLTRGGMPVAGMMDTTQMQMAEVPPHWAVYLSVDDVDARLAKAHEHGAETVVPPMDVPTVGRMALIKDPQGAHIWLFKGAS